MSNQRTHRQALLPSHSLQKHTKHLPPPQHAPHMASSSPVSHTTNPLYHIQPSPRCSSPIGQKKKNHPFDCSYITDLSHLEKISCCPNHIASPRPPPTPSPPSNKASHSVSRDKSPTPTPHAPLRSSPPPSISFHSPCGASHSGPALRSHPRAPPSLHHTGTISL